MTDKLTFVHLTDLHVGDPAVPDPGLMTDTNTTLRTILGEVKRVAPAFVIVSGDIVNRGTPGSYAEAKAIFAEAALDMPVLLALGNHDDRAIFRQAMLGETGDAPYDYDTVVSGLHVIVLDTSIPGRIGGRIDTAQFAWLEARLAAHPEQRKLLVMHHGPMLDEDDPSTAWECIGVAATRQLQALLAGRTDIVGILSGHIHYDRVSLWHGIPVIVGIGQHNTTDVTFLAHGLRSLAAASFAVCTLRPSGLTVAFAPQPSDRRELAVLDTTRVAAFMHKYDGPPDVT